jgi:glycosyltransferase involved in cell wall biosynthesis
MKLVWLSWKDIKHPQAGGAEKITDNILARLCQNGHEVILLTSRPSGTESEDTINGYKVIRNGSRFGVYWQVYRYYKQHLADWSDITIEEVNTIPFFSRFYAKQPVTLFFHQLAREVWFYQMPRPLSYIGYWLEPLYLRLLNKQSVITISQSTKDDLIKTAGFKAKKIKIIREGIELNPIANLASVKKFPDPTLLSLGSVRPMKQTAEIVKAFEHAKKKLPNLKLVIAGDAKDAYGAKVANMVAASPYVKDISMLGSVSIEEKYNLMRRAHVMAVTSVKEGWGLVVTEANSQGTPVVAYDVDGLRDSVRTGETGFVTATNSSALGDAIVTLCQDQKLYAKIRQSAWQDSKQYTFDNLYKDFLRVLK